jgi:hypothetical protein
MPNPVAVNDLSPISGSLQTSRISYGVETAGKNYGQNYNSTTWYSDIPNNGQFYTIISDNYTANYYNSRSLAEGAYVEGGLPAVDEYSAPVFWVTVGTSDLDVATIVNGLPDRVGKVPFAYADEALNWVASSSNYFAVGPDYYEQIDADRLGLYLDANQVISYPITQSTWYDLSGQSQNFTLYNGVKWQNDGWFEFDLTDDYMLNTTVPYQSSSGTIVVTCYPNSGLDNDYIAGVGGNLTIGGSRAIGIISNRWWFVGYGSTNEDYQSGIPVNYDRWSHVAYTWNNTTEITASANGVFEKVIRTGLVTPNGVNFTLGRPPWNTAVNTWGGFLSKVQFYPKALTEAEMLQNYYGGPIVTDSLYSMLDASNLVSYPKTGTTAYELVSSGAGDGSLTNGPTFTTAFGGGWIMDGVDDYLRTSVNSNAITPNNDWTVSIWCSLNNYPTITGSPKEGILFGYALYGGLGIYAISSTTGTVNVYGYFRSDSVVDIFGSYVWTLNTPTMFTLVHEAGVGCKFYVNDQLNYNYPGMTGGNWPGYMSLPFDLFSPQNGVYGGGSNTYIYYPITTYSTQVYLDKALTTTEVLQNYNATK